MDSEPVNIEGVTASDDAVTTVGKPSELNGPPIETNADPHPGGAPANNQNAYKHGLRSAKLGPGMEYIGRKASMFRKTAEAEALNLRGKLGVWEQSLLQSATQWLITALKIERLLRVFDAELTHDQRVTYSERVARACNERDKCLQKLGLDRDDGRLSTLYASPIADDTTTVSEPAESRETQIEREAAPGV